MANCDKIPQHSLPNSVAHSGNFFQIPLLTVVSHFRANCAEFGPVIKVVLEKPTVACIHKINNSFFSQKHADNKSDGINM